MVNNRDDKRLWKAQSYVMSVLDRLDMFTILHARDMSNLDIMHTWEQFSTCNLLMLTEYYLQNAQITESAFVFNKMDAETKSNLTTKDIETLLNLLPHDMDLRLVVPWLQNMFSFAMNKLPDSLSLFVRWLINKVRALERDSKHAWPQFAMELARKVLDVLCCNEIDLKVEQQFIASDGVLTQITDIIENLQDIQVRKYFLQVTIDRERCVAFVSSLLL